MDVSNQQNKLRQMINRATMTTMEVDMDDISDFLRTCLHKEKAYQPCDFLRLRNDLKHQNKNARSAGGARGYSMRLAFNYQALDRWEMSTRSRWQIGQWFHRINEDFIFSQDFPTIAMNYFDRFLSRSEFQPTSKQEVELLALTCYYLAVKILRVGPIFSIDQMSLISGGVFSTTQIAAMEKQVLFTLDWNLYPPCATDFLRPYFMALLGDKNVPADLCRPEVVDLALKMLNAATLDYFFIAHQLSPSHLAAAALLDAMRFFLPICISTPTVQDIVRVLALHTGCHLNEHQVFVCCERFWGIIETINHGNYWSPTTASPLSDFSWSNHFCGNSSPPGAMAVAIPQQSPSSIIGLSNYLILSKQQDVTFEQEGPCTVPWLQ